MRRVASLPVDSSAWLGAMKGTAPCTAKKARMAAQQSSSVVVPRSFGLCSAISAARVDQGRAGRGHDGAGPQDNVFREAERDVDDIVRVQFLVGGSALFYFAQG